MGHAQLIISLSPNMLCVAAVNKGLVVQSEHLDLDPGQWKELWNDGLLRLDQPLRQLISRFAARSFSWATVLYQSPTLNQQIYTLELSPADAQAAAVAKMRESVGFTNPVETCVLSENENGSACSTILAYTEREEQLRSLYAWLNRCQLSVDSFVPTSTAIMNATAETALGLPKDTAVFYLGADVSVIAFASESGLKIIRSSEMGYRTLMEGYFQAFDALSSDSDESDGDDIVVDHLHNASKASKAFQMLFEHGIPLSPSEVDGVQLRTSVLPVLAPVLQRFCIEIKQTFRFGLGGAEMPKNLMLCGPGASIPHMSHAISQHIDMHIKVDPALDGIDSSRLNKGAADYKLLLSNTCPSGLLPEIARNTNTQRLLSKCLIAGVAMAAMAMGGEYLKASVATNKMNTLMEVDSLRFQAVNDFQSRCDSAAAMSHVISDVAQIVSETVEVIPEWHGLLGKLADIKPDGVRVLELRGDATGGTPTVQINGIAATASEKQASSTLNRFVSELDRVEGVSKVTLGATSRVRLGDNQWGRQFVIHVELLQGALPHEALIKPKAESATWGAP